MAHPRTPWQWLSCREPATSTWPLASCIFTQVLQNQNGKLPTVVRNLNLHACSPRLQTCANAHDTSHAEPVSQQTVASGCPIHA